MPPVFSKTITSLRLLVFILAMLSAVGTTLYLSPADAAPQTVEADTAQLSGDPVLGESDVTETAGSLGGVAALLKKHPELERHVSFDSETRIWTVFWSLPGNYRRQISVEIDDRDGRVAATRIATEAYLDNIPSITEDEAIEIAGSQPAVAEEIAAGEVDESADFGTDMVWTVSFERDGADVAQVLIEDATGIVDEVRIGPQVLWQMARGYEGAFGRVVNKPYVWLPLCLLFLLPFIDIRRPLRLVHLDLLVLLSFSVSHYYFNRGEIGTSVPLAYPPMAYLMLRLGYLAWIRRPRPSAKDFVGLPFRAGEVGLPHLNFGPLVLTAGLIILIIFRLIINFADSNVVDVGYSGVIGADLIQQGQSPYGNFPSDNSNGDTYGPLNYLVYVPFERLLPWSGEWDELPAAHAAAIFFDLAAIAGMFFAGRRLAGVGRNGNLLGIALAYAWAAYPYTAYVQNCNVNDTITAAFIVWGFVLLPLAPLSGLMLGFATQTKFFPVLLAPIWSSLPCFWRGWRRRALFILGFAAAVLVTLPIVFLGEGSLSLFWERTLKWQIGRDSPFSIWGQYPERLALAQKVGQYLVVALAALAFLWPPRKTMTAVAAASAALLVAFEMVQTHWFYLYIPWFFPLAFIALLVRQPYPGRGKPRPPVEVSERALTRKEENDSGAPDG